MILLTPLERPDPWRGPRDMEKNMRLVSGIDGRHKGGRLGKAILAAITAITLLLPSLAVAEGVSPLLAPSDGDGAPSTWTATQSLDPRGIGIGGRYLQFVQT